MFYLSAIIQWTGVSVLKALFSAPSLDRGRCLGPPIVHQSWCYPGGWGPVISRTPMHVFYDGTLSACVIISLLDNCNFDTDSLFKGVPIALVNLDIGCCSRMFPSSKMHRVLLLDFGYSTLPSKCQACWCFFIIVMYIYIFIFGGCTTHLMSSVCSVSTHFSFDFSSVRLCCNAAGATHAVYIAPNISNLDL